MRKIAVILFNLGGPDGQKSVRPFLFNLFNDGAIISLPQPLRWLLAQTISRSREKLAQANYAFMGGGSPIVLETEKQARALEAVLAARGEDVEYRCFLAMRYWHPFTHEAAQAAKAWGADEAVLLPLYPHYSSTTTASSLAAWRRAPALPARAICCYPSGAKFAQAHADAILQAWRDGGSPAKPRVLFSAHGLPQRVIDAGDPYQWQIEQSAAAVRALLPLEWEYQTSYQSKVGRLVWIGPSTEAEVDRAAHEGVGLIVSPIAFVSEHVETLVELDIEYAQRAAALGAPYYLRAPALGAAPRYIETLADLVARASGSAHAIQSETGVRICPAAYGLCPNRV
ncbi:MAG: ferrochelatase [Terricaulis sp.]